MVAGVRCFHWKAFRAACSFTDPRLIPYVTDRNVTLDFTAVGLVAGVRRFHWKAIGTACSFANPWLIPHTTDRNVTLD